MFHFSSKCFIISAALSFFYTHSHSLKMNDWNLLSLLLISVQYDDDNAIGYLHVGVILLLRPESFSSFFSYLDLMLPARFK